MNPIAKQDWTVVYQSLIQQCISNYQHISHFQAVIVNIPRNQGIEWGEGEYKKQ